jgi:ribonucleotide reductase alpha subunit
MVEEKTTAPAAKQSAGTNDASRMTQLEGIRQKVFMDRYSLKDPNGQALEFYPEQLWARVARGIAEVEKTGELQKHWEQRFYEALENFQFVPGGRILAGAGSGHQVTFYNCYVIPSPEDSRQGILDNLKLMTEIMARGGGVGINLSTLRPRGSYIKTVNGTASGPCSWAQLYSVATGDVIQQGGSRRGALMLMLDDNHPDIEEFITVKRTAGKIEHANLSVCVSDKFMQAVKDDADWNLLWQGEVKKTIRARELWDLICTSAWASAEPGLVFIDRYNKLSNTWYYEDIRCVNPCVTGDTLIYTDQGLIPARELAERGTPVTVVSPDITVRELAPAGNLTQNGSSKPEAITTSSGSVSFRQASHVFPTGIKPVYRLQTAEGYTIRLTSDHNVLTTRGWKAASHLVAGDKIHALNGQAGFDNTENVKLCLATFESLTPDGEEMVYDLSEQEAHQFVANGLVVHNCGEQGLPPFGVCNLGALNLSAFVVDGKMDYQRLAEMSKVAMRFLDNVVDANEYFIEENRVAQLGTRRTGLGTMGLADALIKMEIPYGSEESVPVIERIYTTIRDASYEMSADIALEKGPFAHFERDKYMRGEFIKRLPRAIQEKIKKQGIRNAVLLTQAPTGTTSLFSGVSSGIEPVYDFAMVRRDRTGEHILYHPLLQAWRDAHANEPTPKYFVSSNDLTPEEHVRVQATIQRYTDSSISKTVNAPNNHTVEQVQTLYRLAYETGCKGVTYYRDGSRDAVLTRVADEKKAEEQAGSPGVTMEAVTSIQDGVKPRPPVVHGYTRQVSAPEGKINVTINSDEHGPLEVFVNVGKAGSDIAALAEALGRLISLNLRILSPLSQTDRAREIAEQLRGIGGSRSVGFGMQQVRSLPDAVARALEMHFDEMKQQAEHEAEAEAAPIANSKESSNGHGEQAVSLLSMSQMSITGNLCPECGCNTMVYEEGCKKCYNCGHSEC